MDLVCTERESDSAYVERIWHCQGEKAGTFISMAEIECGMVVTKFRGRTFITLLFWVRTVPSQALGPRRCRYLCIAIPVYVQV
jgi:hypothetical protein